MAQNLVTPITFMVGPEVRIYDWICSYLFQNVYENFLCIFTFSHIHLISAR